MSRRNAAPRSPAGAGALVALLAALAAPRAFAAEPWPAANRLFPAPLADPTQPAFAARIGGGGGGRTRGDAWIGGEFGLVSWGAGRRQLGVAAGVASRFDLSLRDVRQLQVADYTFALPVDVDLGPCVLRAAYRHVSSHLGDDRLDATGEPVRKRASDELGLDVSAPFAAGAGLRARAYAGGGFAYNVLPDGAGRVRLQGGGEVRRPLASRGSLVAAADLRVLERAGWDPALTVRAGWESPGGPAGLALFLEYAAGPLPFLAFADRSESRWGLGLTLRR